MSGQNTPFIPPLGTPEPELVAPVIPTSPPSLQSSRSRPGSASGGPPPGWGAPTQQPQMPFYGIGTPYNAPYIPMSPYSQGLASAGFGGFSQLPPEHHALSADYRGYPDIPPTPLMGPGGVHPFSAPVIPQQRTPWHGGGGTMPLHHGQLGGPPQSPWGLGQGQPRGWPGGGGGMPFAGSHASAGWGGGGYASPEPGWGAMNLSGWEGGGGHPGGGWPGMHPGMQPSIQQEPPRRYDKEAGDRMSKFTAGSHYGPVLTALQLQVVGAVLDLNPLLTPVPESGPGSEKTYLRWNMLMESSLVHRSCDPLQVSWSGGRSEPATFPRLHVLKIVSEHYPWLIEVKARNVDTGVTCGEVIEAIAQSMEKLTSKGDYSALPGNLKKMVLDAYRYNRSRSPDVPGGKMGDGLKRVDFLGQMTAFGGLEVDSNTVRGVCGVMVPGYVVLRCDKREFMTPEEVRAQHAREREASQISLSASRAGSTRSSRGSGSVAGSTRTGIGVDIESPSDDSDGNSTE